MRFWRLWSEVTTQDEWLCEVAPGVRPFRFVDFFGCGWSSLCFVDAPFMLFNSAAFLFGFLPVVLFLFGWLHDRFGREAGWLLLAVASVIFYGWWNPIHVPLLLGSVVANFWLGRQLGCSDQVRKALLLTAGVLVNLGLLGYYKYWHFIASNLASVMGQSWHVLPLELPPGISFYTFHQLAYLMQCRACNTQGTSFKHYLLYVTFFPQLIAGPIVRPHEMLPQLQAERKKAFRWDELSLGLTLLIIGLFKKMVIADHVAVWVAPVFDQAARVGAVSFLDAWISALAYTFQLYFDFSAYSDMAVGLALMMGIRMPANFYSPYKATSIVDFWRRWHITLSLFLRDYLYIPLGGNRKGKLRQHLNLIVVMVIGGFWHGAGWTFGLWGLWHGICLLVNHAWHQNAPAMRLPRWFTTSLSWCLTLLAVIAGWVLFRAPDMKTAWRILSSMVGAQGVEVPAGWLDKLPLLAKLGLGTRSDWVVFSGPVQIATLGLLMFAVLALPNAVQLTAGSFAPINMGAVPAVRIPKMLEWKPNLGWAVIISVMLVASLLYLTRVSEFLYFQF